jgi:hypothetical protein
MGAVATMSKAGRARPADVTGPTPVEVWAPAFSWLPPRNFSRATICSSFEITGGVHCKLCEAVVPHPVLAAHVRKHQREWKRWADSGGRAAGALGTVGVPGAPTGRNGEESAAAGAAPHHSAPPPASRRGADLVAASREAAVRAVLAASAPMRASEIVAAVAAADPRLSPKTTSAQLTAEVRSAAARIARVGHGLYAKAPR